MNIPSGNLADFKLQSNAIDLLRFPLALAVIMIHVPPHVTPVFDAGFSLLSVGGIYNFIVYGISHILAQIAVPTFFIISGFLFFLNMPEMNLKGYMGKVKSRVRTLFIPYVLWNYAPVLLLLFLGLAQLIVRGNSGILLFASDFSLYEILWLKYYLVDGITNFWGNPLTLTGPLDYPLWFMRDLMVVILLSPAVYFILKYIKAVGLTLFYLCLYFRFWPWIPGLSIEAVFYFSLGAYFALNRLNIVDTISSVRHALWLMAGILLIICTWFGREISFLNISLFPLWIMLGSLSAVGIAGVLVRKGLKPNAFLVSSCFFLYALHVERVIPIFRTPVYLFESLRDKIVSGDGLGAQIFSFLFVYICTVFFCLAVYAVFRRFMPRLTSLLSGGR